MKLESDKYDLERGCNLKKMEVKRLNTQKSHIQIHTHMHKYRSLIATKKPHSPHMFANEANKNAILKMKICFGTKITFDWIGLD